MGGGVMAGMLGAIGFGGVPCRRTRLGILDEGGGASRRHMLGAVPEPSLPTSGFGGVDVPVFSRPRRMELVITEVPNSRYAAHSECSGASGALPRLVMT